MEEERGRRARRHGPNAVVVGDVHGQHGGAVGPDDGLEAPNLQLAIRRQRLKGLLQSTQSAEPLKGTAAF